jgi:hypothetical protein
MQRSVVEMPRHLGSGANDDLASTIEMPTAHYGVLGRVVRELLPHTEADADALMFSLLTAAGNCIGANPKIEIAHATPLWTNLFLIVIGETGQGRKGTSWSVAKNFMRMVDPSWVSDNIESGLSSGEGLITRVRDEVVISTPQGAKHRANTQTIPGVTDKRVLVVETEFARALQAQGRQNNTLSAVLRDVADHSDLCILTKNRLKATNPHVSLIAHVTPDEFRALLGLGIVNGFANRFIYCWSERSKLLAIPTQPDSSALSKLASQVNEAIEFARNVHRVHLSPECYIRWTELYTEWSQPAHGSGLAAAVTARLSSQAQRLAMILALLDHETEIRLPHLEAASELIESCKWSMWKVFDGRTGNALADRILEHLNFHTPVTRTDLHGLLGRHKSAAQIETALRALKDEKLVRCWKEDKTEFIVRAQ